jgi:HTH-type transcriptional regulator/antitoxin HigA
MEIKVIKRQAEHEAALEELERLSSPPPPVGSKECDRLELLVLLIEDYERRQYKFAPPDPIDVIEFRMSEANMRQIDLVPFLGSRSRVSEVLSRKRPLTLQMIRALSEGLGIKVESLVGSTKSFRSNDSDIPVDESELKKFPIKEMERRGWFRPLEAKTFSNSNDLIRAFLGQVEQPQTLFRRTVRGNHVDSNSRYSIMAWTARVLIRAKSQEPKVKFDTTKLSEDWFRDLVNLSWFEKGPLLAVEYLHKSGIATVIEPHLPGTLIDGASLLSPGGFPVVGLTLRYDRIDNFWFTLLHEIAHISKHIGTSDEVFVDRIDGSDPEESVEKEANRIARDALIPRAVWRRSKAFLVPSRSSVLELASELRISPAIVVGRLQKETGNYTILRDMLGQGQVKKLFDMN